MACGRVGRGGRTAADPVEDALLHDGELAAVGPDEERDEGEPPRVEETEERARHVDDARDERPLLRDELAAGPNVVLGSRKRERDRSDVPAAGVQVVLHVEGLRIQDDHLAMRLVGRAGPEHGATTEQREHREHARGEEEPCAAHEARGEKDRAGKEEDARRDDERVTRDEPQANRRHAGDRPGAAGAEPEARRAIPTSAAARSPRPRSQRT